MTEQELQQLIPTLEAIVTTFEEGGFETSLQRAAIASIQKEQGASFKLVGSKYTTLIRTKLCEQEIPHVEIPTSKTQSAFVVPISMESSFLTIQGEIMFETIDFVRYCTPQNLIDSAKEMGYKEIIRISFKDRIASRIAVQELCKLRIPTSVLEKEDEVILFVHPEYLYQNGNLDFVDFRLQMAMYETEASDIFGGDFSEFIMKKVGQTQYDEDKLQLFAKNVKNGNPMVYGDAFAKSPCYLESKNYEIEVHERQEEGWTTRKIPIPDDATVFEIRNVCRAFLLTIKNANVLPKKTWNVKFRDGSPDKRDAEVVSIMKSRPLHSVETKPFYKLQCTKMQPLIEALSRHANQTIANQMGMVSVTDATSIKAAYDSKSEEIISLIEQGLLPEIQEFLKDEEEISSDKKTQWLMDLLEAFEGEKPKAMIEMNMSLIKGERVSMEIEQVKEKSSVEREGVKE